MPTKPIKTKSIKDINAIDLLNATRNSIGGTYAAQVPVAVKVGDTLQDGRIATKDDSIMSLRAIGNILSEFQPLGNAFLNNIVNRIARVMITSRLYENPWSRFKKGYLEYGETVEEIFVQLARPYQFNANKEGRDVFKKRIPDVKTAFHSMNYQKYYPVTVSTDQLRQAFLSYEGVNDLVGRIIEQVYTGANYDEFLVMKYMIATLALNGAIHSEYVGAVNKDTARDVTTNMVSVAKKLGYMSNKYNDFGVQTYTDISKLYTILTTDIESLFDVNVLALSFNMDKAELLGRQISVDGFGEFDNERLALIFEDDPYTTFVPFTESELESLSTIVALMVDQDWFMIFDNFQNMTEIYNPEELYWNYFYHVWKTFSVSPFSNAVLFTSVQGEVLDVLITNVPESIKKGSSVQLGVNVQTSGFVNKVITWAIDTHDDSTITDTGLLTIAADSTKTEVAVEVDCNGIPATAVIPIVD